MNGYVYMYTDYSSLATVKKESEMGVSIFPFEYMGGLLPGFEFIC